jgi:hypothetical protein
VKLDVSGFLFGQHPEEVAAKLFARGATEPMAPPNFAERMYTGIPAPVNGSEPLLQFFVAAQRILDRRHPFYG